MRYLVLIPVVMLLATACESKPKAPKNPSPPVSEASSNVPSSNQVMEFPADHLIPEETTPAKQEEATPPKQEVSAPARQEETTPANQEEATPPIREELSKPIVPAESMDFAKPSTDAEILIKEAVAIVKPTEGNSVTGKVTFAQEGDDLYIIADFEGLKPGEHGFHIHEKGDCSAHDASSAGGHFNPTNKQHGGPNDEERHAGDLGNVTADETGKAHYEFTDKVLKLHGETNIIGRSVVVHADRDDLKTQPTGNSGARIGCGVIEAAK